MTPQDDTRPSLGELVVVRVKSQAWNQHALPKTTLRSCAVIRLGDHVTVKGEDEEAIVTAVHPDSQVEIEFLHASEGGPRRRRYAAEALEKASRTS